MIGRKLLKRGPARGAGSKNRRCGTTQLIPAVPGLAALPDVLGQARVPLQQR
jgi:hypothetical protein